MYCQHDRSKQFNQQEGESIDTIYGAVTTGTEWKFLKLIEQIAYIDSSSYFISEVEKIIGILIATLQSESELVSAN